MESPNKSKFLIDQHQKIFQFLKSVHLFSRYCLSYLKCCLVNNLQNFLKESYRNVNVALYLDRLWFATLLTNDA